MRSVLNGRAARPMATNNMMTIQPTQTTSTGLTVNPGLSSEETYRSGVNHKRVMVVLVVNHWISKISVGLATDLTSHPRLRVTPPGRKKAAAATWNRLLLLGIPSSGFNICSVQGSSSCLSGSCSKAIFNKRIVLFSCYSLLHGWNLLLGSFHFAPEKSQWEKAELG